MSTTGRCLPRSSAARHFVDDQLSSNPSQPQSVSKRKAPEPQREEIKLAAAAAAVPAAAGAGDAIIKAPAPKAPKLEQVRVFGL